MGPIPRSRAEDPARPRRKGRIVFALMAVLVFVGLAPLASVAWKLIDINREALTTSQQEFQMLLASSMAREVDTRVMSLQIELTRVARALGAGIARRGEGAREEIRRILNNVADHRLVFLRFTDLGGRHVDSNASGTMAPELEPHFDAALGEVADLVERDPHRRPDMARLSPPVLRDGRTPQVALVGSAPVLSRGRFRGVLSAQLDLQAVWDSVVRHNRTGHVIYALDSEARLFASSDPQQFRRMEQLRRSQIVQRFLRSGTRATETLPLVLEENGRLERHLGSYSVTAHGWGLFVQAREDQIYHPVRAMVESTTTWAAVVLVLAVVAGIFFARTLSNPINRLAQASHAFAAGDFTARVHVGSRNEIGELAETFNKMAAEIENYIRRLTKAAKENNELFLGTIRALAQAIDAKDPYTRGHSVRVNKYSVTLAQHLGLSAEAIRAIHVSSLLHDVGKIGIDDAILKKPGMLTDEEFEIMKSHPVLGANIMSPIRQMKNILPGLRYHHERWDGTGYPEGLAGEDIPLMARIIAVADTFDAMTTNRPYQRKMTFAQAAARINELKRVGFDDRIVEAFNRAYQAGELGESEATSGEIEAVVGIAGSS